MALYLLNSESKVRAKAAGQRYESAGLWREYGLRQTSIGGSYIAFKVVDPRRYASCSKAGLETLCEQVLGKPVVLRNAQGGVTAEVAD